MEKEDMAKRISELIRSELSEVDTNNVVAVRGLGQFRAYLAKPHEMTVNFSGGVTGTGWSITRPNGDYRVVYIPAVDCFSLCVESDFGPLDIGVHGSALDCFLSV